ncbi:S8 family serine peptidase [Pelagicoccus sp. SDUM812005]|uniref:S8 family serine peptidase n=1 Tax=Pelagicoccus sp. SDUM812005 TaxID=3041257 RepID=UPI002810013E|nr:S8 family serine peptidase [Pelagicoccus sp. SDUM812005]MDQ8179478.1 S8 family serine peptidase [Pelagicoccus sp. SDUM812005]
MNSRRIAPFAWALLLVGSVVWWAWLREADPEAPEGLAREEVSASAQGPEVEAEPLATSPRGEDEQAVGSVPTLADLQGLQSRWAERYPEARLVEVRVVRSEEGFWRRQHLLERRGARLPWVLWEDKLQREASGEWGSSGYVAHVGNVILVEAAPELVPEADLAAFLSENGLFIERDSSLSDYLCLGFGAPSLGRIEALQALFRERFPGALAEFDTLSFPSATPSDWDASRMWGLDQIGARDAWEFETGAAADEVVIAVIDTGMQRTHPDLAANLFRNPRDSTSNGADEDGNGLVDDVSGWDFFDDDADPQDDDGHGTHVAGIAGAVGNNGSGAVGVSWGARILPLKVGDADGLRTSAINDALTYVRFLKQAGINIVATNNSYGSGAANASTRSEIRKHEELGILFVAASGNEGRNIDLSSDSLEYPAGYDLDNIISVGSSNQEDTLNLSSNYGAVSVDISAPGSDIYSTYPDGDYEFLSGTSMASPMVAGAIALLAQNQPQLTAGELKARILDTADPVGSQNGRTVTGKRLNLLAALKPELGGHFLEVSNVRDAMVLVEEAGTEVVFELSAWEDAILGAELLSGASVGEVREVEKGVFRFRTLAKGQARLRFTASLSGLVRFEERSVVVGVREPVSSGLQRHYAFEGSGSVEPDLAGGSNGSISGATRTQGEYGRSLELNAANERMSFDAAFSDVVTIAALVRSDDMSVSPHPRIVNMPYYYLYFSSGEGLEYPDGNRQTLKFFSNYTSFGVWNTPPRSVKDDQWYFLVGTYDSTDLLNTPSLFVNGREEVVRLQQAPEGAMVTSPGLSYVGNNDVGDRSFEGLIADVRIYDRALGADEVVQLGASLMQDRWSGVAIEAPQSVVREELATLQLSGLENSGGLQVDWYFDREGALDFSESGGPTVEVNFAAEGIYLARAQVSDGVATRVIEREIEVWDGRLTEGHYLGRSDEGGMAWLEVDASLEFGYATVFDAESGFYRVRELVHFGERGEFESAEESSGKLSGVALRQFKLEVLGEGLTFGGELQAVPSSNSPFAGSYAGGGIGAPGDSARLEVLPDGRTFLWREGPDADLAFGSLGIDGGLLHVSASGAPVELTIDAGSGSVRGTWAGQPMFLKEEGLGSSAVLKGGLVGGYPSGSGAAGMYSEFLQQEVLTLENLRAGALAGEARLPAELGPFVLLGAKGESLRMAGDKGRTAVAASVAAAVQSGALSLDAKIVRGIRLQTPISKTGSGLIAFSVEGEEPLEVLVRGLGPSFSVSGAEDPKISLYRLEGGAAVRLAPNDDWRDGALFSGEGESAQGAFRALASGFEQLELSPLADEAKDAAQRVWLEAGNYVVLIELANGVAGSALLEVLAL